MNALAAVRAAGVGVALDDVGSDPDVLAWLDVIDPDVVKLDLTLIHGRPAPEQARVLNAVYAFHERSGAVILAEGIETDSHLDRARSVGATLGQGYRFGGPTPAGPTGTHGDTNGGTEGRPVVRRRQPPPPDTGTPFDAVTRVTSTVRTARKDLLATFSREVEEQAGHATDRPLLLAAVQHGTRLPAAMLNRYQRLASTCSLVAVFGHALSAVPDTGIVTVDVAPADPLSREWSVIVLGSHTAFALIAREHRDTAGRRPDENGSANAADEDARRFDFVVTTDRTLVVAAATTLLARLIP